MRLKERLCDEYDSGRDQHTTGGETPDLPDKVVEVEAGDVLLDGVRRVIDKL